MSNSVKHLEKKNKEGIREKIMPREVFQARIPEMAWDEDF